MPEPKFSLSEPVNTKNSVTYQYQLLAWLFPFSQEAFEKSFSIFPIYKQQLDTAPSSTAHSRLPQTPPHLHSYKRLLPITFDQTIPGK